MFPSSFLFDLVMFLKRVPAANERIGMVAGEWGTGGGLEKRKSPRFSSLPFTQHTHAHIGRTNIAHTHTCSVFTFVDRNLIKLPPSSTPPHTLQTQTNPPHTVAMCLFVFSKRDKPILVIQRGGCIARREGGGEIQPNVYFTPDGNVKNPP